MTPADQEHRRTEQYHRGAIAIVRLAQPWQPVGVRKWELWSLSAWGRPIREGRA